LSSIAVSGDSQLKEDEQSGNGTDVCDCAYNFHSGIYQIDTNLTCSNCVFGDYQNGSTIVMVTFKNHNLSMTVTFVNCTFIRTQTYVDEQPMVSTAIFLVSFVDCRFEGSSLHHKDPNLVSSVVFYHMAGVLQAQFVRCEFVNNVNGALLIRSDASSMASWIVIDSCNFYTTENNTATINSSDDNGYGDSETKLHNFYPAVGLTSINMSMVVRNSTFRSISIHNDDQTYEENAKKRRDNRFTNGIHVVEEHKTQQQQRVKEEKSRSSNTYDDTSAAISVAMVGNSNHERSNVTIDSCVFQQNSAFVGAIHISSGFAFISNSLFEGNQGALGGAISAMYVDPSTWLPPFIYISSCQFINNTATNQGGVFYSANSNFTVFNSTFKNNRALFGAVGYLDGSNLFSLMKTTIDFDECTFRHNFAQHIAGIGVIYALDAYVMISNSDVRFDDLQEGQVFFYLLTSQLIATNCTIYRGSFLTLNGGVALLEGINADTTLQMTLTGGLLTCTRCVMNNSEIAFILNPPCQLVVQDSNFTHNVGLLSAANGGSLSSEAIFERCFFYNNSNAFSGFTLDPLGIQSSTFIATKSQGLVFDLWFSTLNITDSTLLLHNADLFVNIDGRVYFENTVVSNALSHDKLSRPILTNFTALSSFSATNSQFYSMTFNLYRVTIIFIISLDKQRSVTNAKSNPHTQVQTIHLIDTDIEECNMVVHQSGVVVLDGLYSSNSTIRLSANVTAESLGSTFQSTPIILEEATLSIASTHIDCCDNSTRLPISLTSSNLTIYNAMMVSTVTSPWFVNCLDNGTSWVSGDFLGWNISPDCQTRYRPLKITDSANFPLLMLGATQFIELVLSGDYSGVNISLSLTFVSDVLIEKMESAPSQPITVAMYLTRSECTQDMYFTPGSNFVSSTSDFVSSNYSSVLNIGFDGPSPSFLEPTAEGTTIYCLMINSSIPFDNDNVIVNLDALFISRKLATSTMDLTPKYAIYSSVFEVEYEFYDQWGVPFVSSDAVDILCNNENGALSCGHTNTGSSGHTLLSLNESAKLSWRLFTKVNASLALPNAQPVTAYGMLFIISFPLISFITDSRCG